MANATWPRPLPWSEATSMIFAYSLNPPSVNKPSMLVERACVETPGGWCCLLFTVFRNNKPELRITIERKTTQFH